MRLQPPRLTLAAFGLLIVGGAPTWAGVAAVDGLSAQQIVARMTAMNEWRARALNRYAAERVYFAENKRFGKRAEVRVREFYRYPGYKDFRIESEEGSSFIRRKVIDKLLQTEVESSQDDEREDSRITPDNYAFELLGAEESDGRRCYVFSLEPHVPKKYLIAGRVWIDAADFAVVRLEGRPAKKPSIWVKKASIVRRYQKLGPFWLPLSLESVSQLWIVGESRLRIDYQNYQINESKPGEAADAAGGER